jgi:hypothetical protein
MMICFLSKHIYIVFTLVAGQQNNVAKNKRKRILFRPHDTNGARATFFSVVVLQLSEFFELCGMMHSKGSRRIWLTFDFVLREIASVVSLVVLNT